MTPIHNMKRYQEKTDTGKDKEVIDTKEMARNSFTAC
jgi:hypothetical protein